MTKVCPVTEAMVEAARRASDWVADLRDDEIAHIYTAMEAARPPMKIIPAEPIVFEPDEAARIPDPEAARVHGYAQPCDKHEYIDRDCPDCGRAE